MKVMSYISLAGRGRKVSKRQKEGKGSGGQSGRTGRGRRWVDYERMMLASRRRGPEGSRASIKAAIPNKILPGKPY